MPKSWGKELLNRRHYKNVIYCILPVEGDCHFFWKKGIFSINFLT